MKINEIPSLREEKKLWKKGYKYVAGLDEAGRGCLAGPVFAAIIMIKNPKIQIPDIKDSKKLSAKKREELYKILTTHPFIEWATARASEKLIDKINILKATKLAMKRAIKNLEKKLSLNFYPGKNLKKIDFVILDGNFKIDLPVSQKSIVKADEKVFSCAAASIIAKIKRDKIMENYHKKYSQYRFDLHKGYPTKLHRRFLKKYGPCKIHRRTFQLI